MRIITKRTMPHVDVLRLLGCKPAGVLTVRNDGAKTEELLADVKAELSRIGDQVKRVAEDAMKEAKNAGEISAQTKAKADELLIAQTALNKKHTDLEDKLHALQDRNRDLEQSLQARNPLPAPVLSEGAQVVNSEDYKSFIERGARGQARFVVKNTITSGAGSAGALITPMYEREIVGMPMRQLRIKNLLPVIPVDTDTIYFPRMTTRTNNASPTAEAAQKPESAYVWESVSTTVRTIPHFIKVSRQALMNASQLQGEIDTELRYGVELVEETQILSGSGAGQNLSGLITNATAFSGAFSPSNKQLIDVLRLAILQASLSEYMADGIVLHPTDWARIETTKDGQQNYIVGSPFRLMPPSLWGLPVVATQSITVDKFLVGAFRVAATVYDRMQTEVLLSTEDSDNFQKNLVTIRAEKMLALAVKRALALIYGDFSDQGV